MLALCGRPAWCAPAAIPPLTGPVMDEARMLSLGEAAQLRERLLALGQRTGAQLVFASVAELGDEEIEERAVRMAEAWRIGGKKSDDGVLVVVAPSARRLRIEVGYGLEGILPDAVANRLIAATLADFPGGMNAAAVRSLCERLCETLERNGGPADARGKGVPPALVEPSMASACLGIVLGLVAAWLTIGRWWMRRLPFRPLRPPEGSLGRRRGNAGTFRDSLWYGVLFGWLFGGRGGRGGRDRDDNDNDNYRGGGGGFGGGGASGRW